MAKNKGSFGRGKVEVEESDEFIDGMTRLGKALQPHAKTIILGFAGLLLLIAAVSLWSWNNDRKAQNSTADFAMAIRIARVPVEDPGELTPETNDFGIPESYPSAKARAQAVLEALESVESLPPVGRVLRAEALMVVGRFDDAVADFSAAGSASELFRKSALEAAAYASEEKALANDDASARQAGLEDALTRFEELGKQVPQAKSESTYHRARLLATLGKTTEAISAFEQIIKDEPTTELKPDIDSRLAVLRSTVEK